MHPFAQLRPTDPRCFGRRGAVAARSAPAREAGSELRLFAWTFAAGFIFVSVYLA